MKLIYCSCVCSEQTYEKLFSQSSQMPGQQVQKYHRILLKGMAQQEDVSIEAISKLPINSQTARKKVVRVRDEVWNSVKLRYLPYFNLRGLSNLLQMFSAMLAMMKVKKEKDTVAVLDVLNISLGIGISLVCKLRRIKVIGIITDLPEFLVDDSRSLFVCQCRRLIDRCSGYVLLTEAMNDFCNPHRKKPYIVIEGQVDSDMKAADNLLSQKYEKRVCLYSGNLNRINGISYFVEGFLKAAIDNTELHIYGTGDFVPELESICKENSNVKYWGVRLNKEVLTAQIRATLLVNPRPAGQEFTKYSFPSKNMEYMASGTPMLTTKLPGMPSEYYPYVFLLEDETKEGVAKMLRYIFAKSPEELHDKGKSAKEFVLSYKSEIRQAQIVLEMIKKVL